MYEVCTFWHFLLCKYLETCPVESDITWCVRHLSAFGSSSPKCIPDCTANTCQITVFLKSCFLLLMTHDLSERTSRTQIPLYYIQYRIVSPTLYPLTMPDINLLAPELFFLILTHPVYKMWILQEPNTLELWNKLHFEEKKKTESVYHV